MPRTAPSRREKLTALSANHSLRSSRERQTGRPIRRVRQRAVRGTVAMRTVCPPPGNARRHNPAVLQSGGRGDRLRGQKLEPVHQPRRGTGVPLPAGAARPGAPFAHERQEESGGLAQPARTDSIAPPDSPPDLRQPVAAGCGFYGGRRRKNCCRRLPRRWNRRYLADPRGGRST